MNPKINTKTKLFAMFIFVTAMLFGVFIIPEQTFALTCNSATLVGNVVINDSPARVRFTYGADYNAVANGRGTPTPTQTFYSNGHIEQFISGLSQNTVYYYRLEVTSAYETITTNISNLKTPRCSLPNSATIVNQNSINQYPTVVLYADKESAPLNGSATIRWLSTNAISCNASGGSPGWAGVKSIGPGSFYIGSLASSATYTITCGNSLGSVTDSVSISVAIKRQSSEKQNLAPKVLAQNWSEPINDILAPNAEKFLGANVLATSFLPTNLFGWLFLLILFLILIFLVRYAF